MNRNMNGIDDGNMQQANAQQARHQQQFAPQDNSLGYSAFDFPGNIPQAQNASDASAFDANNLTYGLNDDHSGYSLSSTQQAVPSTELVRRNRMLGPTTSADQELWNGFNSIGNQVQSMGKVEEDEDDLKKRIELAKKSAQGKRKQIPPFVQKLWSFVEGNHPDLIRWSDDGKSFIVLDEDEFARKLIPELFKHNNYPSFVRQLNMYGFHKTVNITDGSLRQSEKARKGVKPPSMYSHEFFQRNHPELLWLIQKPGGKPSTKRKRDGNAKDQDDSDDDRQYSPPPDGRPHELTAPGSSQDLAQIPRTELTAVRQELQKLQAQQKFISHMITQLKEQNDQFYRQATAFQALHDRHENSINAILSFLATFYNRSLEGHGAQNLVNMFTNAAQNQARHGSVVEEFQDIPSVGTSPPLRRMIKRPPLLLTGPTASDQTPAIGNAVTQPNSAQPSPTPDIGNASNRGASVASTSAPPPSRSPAIKTDSGTPDVLGQIPESNDEMLNLIQNATQASTPPGGTPAFDFNALLGGAGAGSLTPQQRDSVVRSFAKMQGGDGNSSNNQLTTSAPDMGNFTSQLQQSNDALEKLSALQKQQDARVQELNRRLQPLSPTGTIPGLDLTNIDPFDSIGAPGDYDPNSFINFDENAWDGGIGAGTDDNNDYDFGFDNTAPGGHTAGWSFDPDDMFSGGVDDPNNQTQTQNQGLVDDNSHSRIQNLDSEETSPAAEAADEDENGRQKKRRTG